MISVLTVVVEVEKLRHILGCSARVTGIRESGVGIPQLVKEGMDHSFNSRQTLRRSVFEKLGNKVNSA